MSNAQLIENCGLCFSTSLVQELALGTTPATCNMPFADDLAAVESNSYPLELLRCTECNLVQLSIIVDPDEVFPVDYPYSSGNSRALHRNFADLAIKADQWVGGLREKDVVVDIGANDGTLLRKFDGCLRVGVDPTDQILKAPGWTWQERFTEELALQIREEVGPAKVITACNVMAHVDNPDDVLRGVRALLAEDGVFIAENHDLGSIVFDGQWDTVYHEHLRYYDPFTFEAHLNTVGLGTRQWAHIDTHGGSFRAYAGHGGAWDPAPRLYDWEGLRERVNLQRQGIRAAVPPRSWGIGATARATTIINFCDLDLCCVCEVPGSDKIGRLIPGTLIPVVSEEQLFEMQPPQAMLFSWHLAGDIIPKLREAGYRGDVLTPLPWIERYSLEYPSLSYPGGRHG